MSHQHIVSVHLLSADSLVDYVELLAQCVSAKEFDCASGLGDGSEAANLLGTCTWPELQSRSGRCGKPESSTCLPLLKIIGSCALAERYVRAALRGPLEARVNELGAGLLLSAILGVHCDEDLSFGTYGKPSLSQAYYKKKLQLSDLSASDEPKHLESRQNCESKILFNISHDAGVIALACCAVPQNGQLELGVDVAGIPCELKASHKRIDQRYFLERDFNHNARSHNAPHEWARVWSKTEAILKARGDGFSTNPKSHPDIFDTWITKDLTITESEISEKSALHSVGSNMALDGSYTQLERRKSVGCVLTVAMNEEFAIKVQWHLACDLWEQKL